MKKFWLLAIPAALCAAAVVSACASDDAVEAETYRVVYMNGDEVFFSADVKHGEKLPVPENDPERADEGNIVYTFAGWTDEAEGGADDIVDPGEVTSVTSDLTYYAVFDAVSYYTVTFVDGVTGLTIDEQKVPAGGDAEEPEKPEHEGYEFAEWDGSFTDISARTTVTAVYKKLSYTLSLDVLGVITETPVEYGAALAPAAPATVAGLKFDGWYIKGEEGEPVPLSEAYESMPAHAVEAYAEFSVDWTGVGIALPANAVYGGEGATIAHPAYGNMTYTHIWGDESRGDSYVFGGAGLQTVSATVIAVFENENGAYISERRSFEKTVNVGKAELEITASVANLSNGSVVYGTAPAAEFTFSGFVGEDDSSDLGSVSAVYTFENGQPADAEKLEAGAYIISALLEDDNYVAEVRTSRFLVKPRDITLTLTAGDITYGAQPEFTVSADKSQFAYGEDISVLRQGTVVIKKDGAVVSGNLAAGSYTAETGGYKNANYNVIHGTAQFTVKKAALTATVSVEDSYEYGTEITPVLEYAGFVFSDGSSVVDESALKFTFNGGEGGKLGVGSYTVAASGATAANYEISYKEGSFEVTKKTLTVTAEAEDFTYGGTPAPEAEYSGFAYGEDETSLGGKLAFAYEKEGKPFSGAFGAGSYTVKAGGLTSENYDINYVGGTFEVSKAKLTVTVSVENSYVYADAITPEVSYSPFANGDNAGSLGGKLAFSYNGSAAEGHLPVGSYTVTAAGLASDNYEIVYAYGNSAFNVTARTVTVTLSEGATSGNVWQYSDFGKAGVLSGLPEGFAFAGTLELNKTGEGTYTAKGGSLGDDFEWSQPYSVTLGGEDVTANFAFEYDISVTLTDSQFNITSTGTVNTPYTGKEIALGTGIVVHGAPDDMRITYSLKEEGEYAEDIPVGVNAGVYTVYYKITAENYEDDGGSYKATISKANNEITFAGYGEFTYTGEEQTFPLDKFSATFGEVRLAGGENKGTDAGRYTFTVGVDGTDNWNAAKKEVTVEIKKAANILTLTLDYADLTYNGAAQTFGDFAAHFSATYGTPVLVGGETNVFTDAGSHNFKVYVPESDNYLASDEVSVPVKILKNTENKITFTPYGTFTYSGEEQIFPLENFSATFGEVKVTVGSNRGTDAGEYRFTVSVQDTANYNGCEYQVSVTINKAKYTDGQIPEKALRADDVYYHSDVSLNVLGAGDLAEGFSWADGTTYKYVQGLNDNIRFIYNKDSAFDSNYEPIEIFRSFVAYDLINVTVTGGFSGQIDVVTAFTENAYSVLSAEAPYNSGLDISDLSKYISADTSGIDFAVGSTYAVVYTASEAAKTQYCKVMFGGSETGYAPYKLTSVLYDGKYYTIEDAINAATSGSIIVTADTSFAAGEARKFYYTAEGEPDINYYTVKQGVTLLVPYDGNYSTDTKEYQEDTIVAVASEGYVKLTVPTGVNLTINGNLTVNAKRTASKSVTSVVYGSAYGEMEVQSGAYIYLGSTSCFETIGFTYGDGEIVARSGAYVYEPFNMVGWKGGAISTAIQSSVFPLNQYSMTSLAVKTKFEYGSHYYVKAVVKVNVLIFDTVQHADAAFGGMGSDSFIQLCNADSYFYKYVNTADGKHVFEFYGDIQINNMSVAVSGASIDTEGKQIPIPGNFRLDVYGNVTIPGGVEIKLLPGAQLNIMPKQQSTSSAGQVLIKSGAALYAYGSKVTYDNNLTKWQDGQNSFTYPHSKLATSYHVKPDLGYNAETLAVVKVDGLLTVESDGIFAAEISGGMADSVIVFSDNVTLNKPDLREDYTPYVSSWGTKAVYFYSNIITTFSGSETAVQAGNTYKYDGSGWVEQPVQQA